MLEISKETLISEKIREIDTYMETVRSALASKDYYEYVKYTNRGYVENEFGKDLCHRVEEFVFDDRKHKVPQIMILIAPPQHGKACEDNIPVLTTKGWKRHGDLIAGDYVYGIDGLPKLITHAQTSYLHDCVEVTLDSGDSFICAKEHEWVVECNRDRRVNGKRGQRQTEILEAQHIFDGYHAKSPAIKVTMPLQNEDLDLPIDPYLLGLWLGDGSSSDIHITSHINDYEEIAERLIKREHIVKIRNDSGNNKLICVGSTTRKIGSNYFLTSLKVNNLIKNKHIPPMYINASYAQRLELLKGLMDTDGSVTKDGCICEYCGINKTLVLQVYQLVRSLGIKCSFRTGDAKLNGRVISKVYKVQFTPNKEQLIFRLVRKQNRINAKIKTDRNDKNLFFIKSVKECGQHSVKCITVVEGVYLVGNGFVPTHNSTNVTETLPSYYHGQRPDGKIIMLSYGDDLAKKFGNANLVKVHTYGKGLFNVELDNKKPCTSQEYHVKGYNGVFLSRGLTSGVTGNSGELVIIDDPVKNKEEADSENFRNKSWEGYLANVKTRLSAQAKVLIILTRWHEDDLAGRIEAYGNVMGNVQVVRYCCECDCTETDPLGRAIGEALMPEIGKDKDWVQGMKSDYLNDPTQGGRRTWEALFQGRPAALEGNIIQATWFRFWCPKGMVLPPVKLQLSGGEVCEVMAMELPDKYDVETQSWDCTFKDSKSSDYVCGGYWSRRLADFFLLDCYHKQASFTETIDAIMEMTRKYPKSTSKYIENKANGGAVINSLKHKISGIISIEANDDKAARLNAVTPVFRSGNVYFPHPHLYPWVKDLMKEMLDFPNGSNDDYVHMASQALNNMMYDSRNTDIKVIKEGTWAYPQLKSMGYSDVDIRNAYKSGIIKLYLIPDKYKKWISRR